MTTNLHRAVHTVRRPAARSAVLFLGSRALSAVLVLAQLATIAALYPTAAGATFFVLWTLVWASSVWLRFGVDQVIPRRAAQARISGDLDGLAAARSVMVRTAAALAILLPALVGILIGPTATVRVLIVAGLCFAAALAWAVIVLLAALLRGFDAVGRSGVVQGVLPALALLGACFAGGDGWLGLLLASTLALWIALLVGLVVTAVALGGATVRATLLARGPVDPEQLPAGGLTVLGEVGLALPLLLGSALGLPDADVAALYAATRVAAVFSWSAGAVAAVATPRLALAIAQRTDPTPLLRRATLAAALTSLPFAVGAMLFPSQLLGLMSDEFAPYGALLVILVAGRLVDACTGPLSEALIVGGRVRVEFANLGVFVTTVIVACIVLEPRYGIEGLAAAIAVGTVACSLPRVVQVHRALRTQWAAPVVAAPSVRRAGARPVVDRRAVATLALLSAYALLDLAVAAGLLDRVMGLPLLLTVVATTVMTLGLTVAEARRRAGGSWRAVAVTPLAAAVPAFAALYAWRPVSLWLWPQDTTIALTAMGFSVRDLTTATAVAALGCAAWAIGYLALVGRGSGTTGLAATPSPDAMTRTTFTVGAGLLAAASLLWGALFIRQGGFAVLTSAPGELHNGGFSSGYAVLGVWIAQGVALHAFVSVLRGGGTWARRLLALGCVTSLLAAGAMQARGLLFLGVLAAGVVYLCLRTPSRRALVLTAAVAGLAIPAGTFAQQVRSYSQNASPGEALELTVKTPPGTFLISDLSGFDNLVALNRLIPGSVDRLGGESLAAVPFAFVPRSLWPGKPLPLDQQVSAILYPGSLAGSPIGLQGELMWNFGLLGVLLGTLLVGALMGALARSRLRIRRPGAAVLYAIAIASVVAPLTRALAPMATNTAMALLGAGIAGAVLAPVRVRLPARFMDAARAMVDRVHAAPSAGAKRFAPIDGMRGLAAAAVVVTHVGNGAFAPSPSPLANIWLAPGGPAVVAFFALSGFVLYRPFVAARAAGAPEPHAGKFLVRRFVRALPAYWIILTVTAAMGAAPNVWSDDWWRYYFLLQIYSSDVAVLIGGIPPAWTLCVEVTFYLAIAGLAVLMGRRWRAARSVRARWVGEFTMPAVLFVAGLVMWALVIWRPELHVVAATIVGTIGWFAVGIACAVFSVRADHGLALPRVLRAVRDHPAVPWTAGAGIVVWLGTMHRSPTPDRPAVTHTTLEGIGITHLSVLAAALLITPVLLGACPSGRVVRTLASRPLVWLGAVCYLTYLSHHALISAFLAPWDGLQGVWAKSLVGLVAVYAVSVAVGAVSWYLIERPAIRGVARLLRRERTRTTVVGPEAGVGSPA